MSENIIAASWRIGKSSEDKVGHCCTGCCEELWKEDADTITPIIVTKLPGLPSSFNYVVLGVGQEPGQAEKIFTLLFRCCSSSKIKKANDK